jgi:hypothetical protein
MRRFQVQLVLTALPPTSVLHHGLPLLTEHLKYSLETLAKKPRAGRARRILASLLELLKANFELPSTVAIREKVRLSILSLTEPIHVRDFQIPAHLDRVRAQSLQFAGREANCIG